jgi:hypothetical protein
MIFGEGTMLHNNKKYSLSGENFNNTDVSTSLIVSQKVEEQ